MTSVVVNSPTKLTFTLTGPVNPYWFTYNELSQITPMPDGLGHHRAGGAAGSGGCSAGAPTGRPTPQCAAVYTFLSKQAGYNPANPKATNNSFSTYATNPIWQVVDGPWQLTPSTPPATSPSSPTRPTRVR